MHHTKEIYMRRCLELAGQGAGYVLSNPMVGAVLVYENEIIGEGFHRQYGGPHAEVNCLQSVPGHQKHLIPASTLYVSLEPCAHFGKTPPCTDLIVKNRIPHVVVGCRDPFNEVNGKGIDKLRAAGVQVETGILEKECREINKRFFTFHTQHRPHVVLKWAQTNNGKIGYHGSNRLLITNDITNRLVHKWRSEEMGILVGTNTALFDNPMLTNRLWKGPSPTRIVIDNSLRLPSTLHLFDGSTKLIVFNTFMHGEQDHIYYYQITGDVSLVQQVINGLKYLNIQSVLVEGGARLTQSFIDEGAWDEARVITNTSMGLEDGVSAPVLSNEQLLHSDDRTGDRISYFVRK